MTLSRRPAFDPMSGTRAWMGTACAALAAVASGSASALPPPIVYAKTGQSAPELSSVVVFDYPESYAMDPTGRVVIEARVTRTVENGGLAVLESVGGALGFVGSDRTFGSVLSPPQTSLNSVTDFRFNTSGRAYAAVSSRGAIHEDAVLVMPPGGSTRVLTDTYEPAPGVLSVISPAVTPGGGTWFFVKSASTATPWTWVGNDATAPPTMTRVAAAGTQVPSMPAGVLFYSSTRLESVNASGRYAYFTQISGPGITANINGQVILSGVGDEQAVVAQTGTPAPGVPGGTYSSLLPSTTFERVHVADNGEVLSPRRCRRPATGGRQSSRGNRGA